MLNLLFISVLAFVLNHVIVLWCVYVLDWNQLLLYSWFTDQQTPSAIQNRGIQFQNINNGFNLLMINVKRYVIDGQTKLFVAQ